MPKQAYIFDTHCDVLYKLFLDPSLSFHDSSKLDVTHAGLKSASYIAQCFAVFLPEHLHSPSFQEIESYVDIFESKILSQSGIVPIRTSEDLKRIKPGQEIGAILTLEGADALHGSMQHLRTAFRLGVRCLGLTWNYANWAADGVLEPRKAGLSVKGKLLIEECNRIGMIIDVSHLNERGFWDLMQLTNRPVIASHSNVYSLCPHPRNLKHEQLEAIFQSGGMVGITFVPQFVKEGCAQVHLKDVLHHIEAICAMGRSNSLGLGSDYDGIDHHINGLSNAFESSDLAEELYRLYPSNIAEGILWKNWYHFYEKNLPAQ